MLATYKEGIYSSDGTEPATFLPGNHGEGDYRALLYRENMSKEEVNQAMIFTADANVTVIATSVFSELSLLDLWIEFGKTANRKYILVHEILESLGPELAGCLTLFRILTACNQVSFFQAGEKELPGKHGKTTHS